MREEAAAPSLYPSCCIIYISMDYTIKVDLCRLSFSGENVSCIADVYSKIAHSLTLTDNPCRYKLAHRLTLIDNPCRYKLAHRLTLIDNPCRYKLAHSLTLIDNPCRYKLAHSLTLIDNHCRCKFIC